MAMPFRSYMLTNLSGVLNTTKKRLAALGASMSSLTPDKTQDSEYDQRLRAAIIILGGHGLTPAMIAGALDRTDWQAEPPIVRGMAASLQAATGRVDWLERRDGLWGLTCEARKEVSREQLADELAAGQDREDDMRGDLEDDRRAEAGGTLGSTRRFDHQCPRRRRWLDLS